MWGLNRTRWPQKPLQQAKMNLFIDYFNYYTHHLGIFDFAEIESPLSIIDKIIFQLENNKNSKSLLYINHYFENLSKWLPFLKRYSFFAEIEPLISVYKPAYKSYSEFQQVLPSLLPALVNFREDMEKAMLTGAAKELSKMILCDHPLVDHKDGIIFWTRIIGNELLFSTNSRRDVQNLVSQIFSKDIREFPFPDTIKDNDQKETYLKELTTVQRLEAIVDFAKAKRKSWMILFKVEGVGLPSEYEFRHGNSRILSPSHKSIAHLKSKIDGFEEDFLKEHFITSNWSLCEINVNATTRHNAYADALPTAQATIAFINGVLAKSFVLNKAIHFFTQDQVRYGVNLKTIDDEYILTQNDISRIEDNAFNLFERFPSTASVTFLKFQQDYIKARETNSVPALWRYLELLLADGSGNKIVKEMVSGALLLDEKEFKVREISSYLKNAISFLIQAMTTWGFSGKNKLIS